MRKLFGILFLIFFVPFFIAGFFGKRSYEVEEAPTPQQGPISQAVQEPIKKAEVEPIREVKQVRESAPPEWIYPAGEFHGEGNKKIHRYNRKHKPKPIEPSITEEDVIDLIQTYQD